jgi:hypothetical protein
MQYKILTVEKDDFIPRYKEFDIDKLEFSNGYFEYKGNRYEVNINGDERNYITRFDKSQDFPVLYMRNDVFSQDGEFTWMLDDIVLYEI